MPQITALQLIQRIMARTAVPGRPQTVDHVSAGDPTRFVTSIAVVAMAGVAELKEAAAKGHNLVLTYDPAFWSGDDDYNHLESNALFAEKRDFVHAHDMVVFNLHDHWRDRMPDGIATGMARALGWQSDPADANLFRRPQTTLLVLAQELSDKLSDRTLRVVGDPKLPVVTVATSFGNTAQLPGIALLNGPADVLVCGYAHEWEVVEYAQDMIAAGGKKGLILLGENTSVGAGMKYCADWIRDFVPEVKVEFLPAGEPYWIL